jgi:hypothetical protein
MPAKSAVLKPEPPVVSIKPQEQPAKQEHPLQASAQSIDFEKGMFDEKLRLS